MELTHTQSTTLVIPNLYNNARTLTVRTSRALRLIVEQRWGERERERESEVEYTYMN